MPDRDEPAETAAPTAGGGSAGRWVLIVVGFVLAAGVAVFIGTRSGKTDVGAAMRGAGCTYRDVVPYPPKDMATRADYHNDFPTLAATPHWATFPPSGGGHFRLWATWGFYRKAVNPAMVVHNEEHGGVILWWGPQVSAATVDELKRFYDSDPVGVFGTPIAGLDDRIAITAWTADPAWTGDPAFAYKNRYFGLGRIAVCTQFDEKAFATFRDAYIDRSPQGFPLVLNRPGCGPDSNCVR